ncbi:septal ring lytic transglycosylase RlpA family protein [Brevibacterium ravenspurgense]|uniref:septal ring lytic transglycosylase RlpA family protein n=1 Tax=Brevibacterium ravenspurgense TaxID=479117 RepID=UPI0030B8136B
MSKHRAEGTKASGSIFDLFRRSSKRGRYGSEPKSAAGVLASAGRRPVLAAIAVPTAAAASIVAAGFAVTPSAEDEQTQFTQNAAPAADAPDTSAAEKAAKDAEKQQKDSARSLSVKEEEPAEDTQSGNAGSSNSAGSSGKSGSTSKKSGNKAGSGAAASDSGKPKNTKASGKAGSCPASTYGQGDGFHGRKTANGERFNRNAMTAAHKTLPFNSRVKVTNTSNGKSVTVRINDRGPYHGNRCLDLSTAAMNQIGGDGVATVKWQVL